MSENLFKKESYIDIEGLMQKEAVGSVRSNLKFLTSLFGEPEAVKEGSPFPGRVRWAIRMNNNVLFMIDDNTEKMKLEDVRIWTIRGEHPTASLEAAIALIKRKKREMISEQKPA